MKVVYVSYIFPFRKFRSESQGVALLTNTASAHQLLYFRFSFEADLTATRGDNQFDHMHRARTTRHRRCRRRRFCNGLCAIRPPGIRWQQYRWWGRAAFRLSVSSGCVESEHRYTSRRVRERESSLHVSHCQKLPTYPTDLMKLWIESFGG